MTYVDNHPLISDFPEYRQQIHDLKMSDAHFVRMHAEYEALDREIIRVEERLEHRSDQALETLKMHRVQLKDQLYQMLVAASGKH